MLAGPAADGNPTDLSNSPSRLAFLPSSAPALPIYKALTLNLTKVGCPSMPESSTPALSRPSAIGMVMPDGVSGVLTGDQDCKSGEISKEYRIPPA